MTSQEYNDLVDKLYRGHDVILSYQGQRYFLEREEVTHNFYIISDNLEMSKLVKTITGENLIIRINTFLDMPLFSTDSFNEIYSNIDIVDIE